jgi:hypothetical protein
MNTRVFEEWRDKPLDEAINACGELVEDPDCIPRQTVMYAPPTNS